MRPIAPRWPAGRSDRSLLVPFEADGEWWLPHRPDSPVRGKLSFRPHQGVRLDAEQVWVDDELAFRLRHSIVHGRTIGGEECTLYSLVGRQSPNDTRSAIYAVDRAVVGGWHSIPWAAWSEKDKEDFRSSFTEDMIGPDRYDMQCVAFNRLAEWTAHVPFKKRTQMLSDCLLTYEAPRSLSVQIASIDAKIDLDCRPLSVGDDYDVAWHYDARLNIRPSEAKTEDWYQDVRFTLGVLLTLLVGLRVQPTDTRIIDSPDDPMNEQVRQVFYLQRHAPATGWLHPYQGALIRLPDLAGIENAVFNQWFEKADKLRAICELYLASSADGDMYPEARFLAVMQAVESFHLRMRKGEYLPASGFQRVRRAIKAGIPSTVTDDHRKELEDRINGGNRYSLDSRMTDLIKSLPTGIYRHICRFHDAYIQACKTTRNYYTHYPPSLEEVAMKGDELFWMTESLRTLMVVLMLQEAGVPDSVLADRLQENDWVQEVRERQRW